MDADAHIEGRVARCGRSGDRNQKMSDLQIALTDAIHRELGAIVAPALVSGPVSGYLSDRHGARAFASGGLLVSAAAFSLGHGVRAFRHRSDAAGHCRAY